jgi:hypothetical protein
MQSEQIRGVNGFTGNVCTGISVLLRDRGSQALFSVREGALALHERGQEEPPTRLIDEQRGELPTGKRVSIILCSLHQLASGRVPLRVLANGSCSAVTASFASSPTRGRVPVLHR